MKNGSICRIGKEVFRPYGEYYNIKEDNEISSKSYHAYQTATDIITRPLKLGITKCSNEKSFVIDSMERHLSSEEVQIVGNKPIILSVADSDPSGNPRTEDVVSFLLQPGDVIVLKPGIWHDACHSTGGETMYYFLSLTNGEPSETAWLSVKPDPVSVEL
ncbi:MAG TPA: hypothetical protein IAA26_10765 [Candidatus Blautia faecipullorum]|nr:hypothetical protein [Candidatus Blautia faecipullorum]